MRFLLSVHFPPSQSAELNAKNISQFLRFWLKHKSLSYQKLFCHSGSGNGTFRIFYNKTGTRVNLISKTAVEQLDGEMRRQWFGFLFKENSSIFQPFKPYFPIYPPQNGKHSTALFPRLSKRKTNLLSRFIPKKCLTI